MLKMVLATVAIIATMAAAQTSEIWNGEIDTDWYDNSPRNQTEFTITTAEELAGLAKLVKEGNNFSGLTITLVANIMLNDTTYLQDWENNPPKNRWLVIGTSSNRFNGTFDGNGFIVGGVYINEGGYSSGLFAYISTSGTVKNLGVVASLIMADMGSGGLAGHNEGTIINSYVVANLHFSSYTNGGLVGNNRNTGRIENSFFSGNILSGSRDIGGLAGINAGTITNSYSIGNVIGGHRIGGFAGLLVDGGTITNSYSTGLVKGNAEVGGLVGRNGCCHRAVGTITSSFFDSLTSGQNDNSGKGTPRNTLQMKTQNTFVDWDFENIWGMNANINNGYPYLRSFVDVEVVWNDSEFTFNGEEQAPTAEARFVSNSNRKVPIKISGAINAREHTATAVLETPNLNINLLNATKVFTINPKPLASNAIMPIPVQQRTGEEIEPEILVMDGEKILIRDIDYIVSYEDNIELLGRAIATGKGNYTGTINRQFRITEQGAPVVNVRWGEERVFEYNRQIQHPEWTIIHNGTDIGKSGFRILNAHSEAGNYTDENGLAPFILCLSENYKISDDSRSVDYTILPRPLTARLRNTSRDSIRTSTGLTREKLDSILTAEFEFTGFAKDSDGEDDKSTLGRLTFDIKKQDGNSQRSLRSQDTLDFGNYLVEGVSPTSTNYNPILERKVNITIGHRFLILENYPSDNPVPISNVKKPDNRHGIKFAVNPVSDKAEISVMLPNNDKAVETKIAIYDMTGNVVFSTTARDNVSWDLRNSAGRFVANGTYLVVAEVKGASGKIYTYSARLGVKR